MSKKTTLMAQIPEKLLPLLGLTEDEADVYIAALELGEASMLALARKSGINRSTIYTFIGSLKERGFIIEIKKGKRRFYSGVDPEQVVERQKQEVRTLEKMLPELRALYNQPKKKPHVLYFEGVEAVMQAYSDLLQTKENILKLEDFEHVQKTLPQDFFEYFPAERARRDIGIKSITRDSGAAREFAKSNIRLLRETKFMKSDELKTEINIYGNKVGIFDLREDPPFAIIIEDESVASTLRVAWQQLWERLHGPVVG